MSGAAALVYSRGERGVSIYQGSKKGWGSGDFGVICGRRKRATQIELKTEKEYDTCTNIHTYTHTHKQEQIENIMFSGVLSPLQKVLKFWNNKLSCLHPKRMFRLAKLRVLPS